MSDHEPHTEQDEFDKSFEPRGTIVLSVLYLIVFAFGWGFVYFADLLARR